MSRIKKAGLIILAAIIAIQFIQPARNGARRGRACPCPIRQLPTDISKIVFVPENVRIILQTACYDCHSNHINYPWYTYVQPVGWILSNHIKNGKRELNFSDFGSYSQRRQESKFKSIADQIRDGEMPLYSYTVMHKNARLSTKEKALIIDWAQDAKDSLGKKALF